MSDIKQRVALSSIAASAGLTTAKGVVGVMSGSLALLSEAAHSFIDLGATVMTYFAVRSSGKPADAEHHYGHGKIESVSALAETALLFILAGIVIWEAAKRLMSAQPPEVEATPWAFAVILLSILVDFLRARVLYRTAEKTSSHALEADALHYDSDMWSSSAVLVGLFGIALGYTSAEAGGLSILAGMARPDEGLPTGQGGQGVISHALRFTLPSWALEPQYIYPASHQVGGIAGCRRARESAHRAAGRLDRFKSNDVGSPGPPFFYRELIIISANNSGR